MIGEPCLRSDSRSGSMESDPIAYESPTMKRSLLAVTLLLVGSAGAEAQATKWDSVARSLFKELVEINTTESSGSTLAAARAMAARLKAVGFPDSDVVVLENAPKKGNLIARLRGRNTGRKPVLLLSHIDVVEAKAEDVVRIASSQPALALTSGRLPIVGGGGYRVNGDVMVAASR